MRNTQKQALDQEIIKIIRQAGRPLTIGEIRSRIANQPDFEIRDAVYRLIDRNLLDWTNAQTLWLRQYRQLKYPSGTFC